MLVTQLCTVLMFSLVLASNAFCGTPDVLERLERVEIPTIGGYFQGYAQQGIAWSGVEFFTSTGTCNDFTKVETLSAFGSNWLDRQTVLDSLSPNRCHVGDIDATESHIYMPASTFDCNTPFCAHTPAVLRVSRFNTTNEPDLVVELPGLEPYLGANGDLAGIAVGEDFAYVLEYQPDEGSVPHIFRYRFDGLDIIPDHADAYQIISRYANGIALYGYYAYVSRGPLLTSNPGEPDVGAFIDVYDTRHLSTSSALHPINTYCYDPGFEFEGNCGFGDICPHAEGLTFKGEELWVCAEEGRAVYRLETPILPPVITDQSPVVILNEPVDGSAVSGEIVVTASAVDDSEELTLLEFYAGTVHIGSIPNPTNGVPYSVSFDTTPYVGSSILFSAIAYDGSNAGSDSAQVVVDQAAPMKSVDLSITPSVLLADGSSFSTLTATVTDAIGAPVSGEEVAFIELPGTTGQWVDEFGSVMPDPGNGLTNNDGTTIAYFRPTAAPQTCTFSASILGDSDVDSFFAYADSGSTNIIMSAPRLVRSFPTYSEYSISVCFEDNLGNPIQNGCARLTTTRGTWDEGPGRDTAVTLDDIGSSGCMVVDFTVTSSGPGTITVELCESSADCGESVDSCQGSGSIEQETYSFSVGVSPIALSYFSTPDMYTNVRKDRVSTAGGRMALNSRDKGMTILDMYTWDVIINWDESNHNDTHDNWKSPSTMDLSPNGRYLFTSDDGDGVAILDAQTGNISARFNSRNYRSDSDWNPTSDRVVVGIDDYSGDLDAIGIYNTSANELSIKVIGSSGDTRVRGVSWSAGSGASNQRIAVSYDLDSNPDEGFVEIRSGSSYNVLATFTTPDPSDFNPKSICWSPDGNLLAVYDDDEELVYMLNRNGQSVFPGPFAAGNIGATGSIEWSPDGDYIALHNYSGNSVVYDAATGAQVVRMNDGSTGGNAGYDTLGWRDDSQVIVRADNDKTDCLIYAPFDTEPPIVSFQTEDGSSYAVLDPVLVVGSVSDDTGLHPSSVRYRLNTQSWQSLGFDMVNGEFDIEFNLPMGHYSVEVECTDLAGYITSELISFDVVEPAFLVIAVDGSVIEDGDTIDFGTRLVDGPPLTKEFVLQNLGGLPVDIYDVSTESPFMVGVTPAVVDPYSSEIFTISLPADLAGSFEAMGNIQTSDGDGTVTLTGTVCDCLADFHQDCQLNFLDVSAFLQAYGDQNPIADINGDGAFNFIDVSQYLQDYALGCP